MRLSVNITLKSFSQDVKVSNSKSMNSPLRSSSSISKGNFIFPSFTPYLISLDETPLPTPIVGIRELFNLILYREENLFKLATSPSVSMKIVSDNSS